MVLRTPPKYSPSVAGGRHVPRVGTAGWTQSEGWRHLKDEVA